MHFPLKSIGLLLAISAMIGCQSTQEEQPQTPNTASCNAEAVKDLVGTTASPEVLDQARETAGAEVARILRPNDVMTLEYNSRRLNLSTDAALTIRQINCG